MLATTNRLGEPDRAWMCPRDKGRPGVVRVLSPEGQPVWLALSHRAVSQVLLGTSFSRAKSYRSPVTWLNGSVGPETILGLDGADHTRIRSALSRAASIRTFERLRPAISRIVTEQLNRLAATGPPAGFVEVFAGPVSARTTAEFIGAPDADPTLLHHWSEVVMSVGAFDSAHVSDVVSDVSKFAIRLMTTKRLHPDDSLISQLLRDESLTKTDVFHVTGTMIAAATDNGTTMLAHCLVELHDRADRDRLIVDRATLGSVVDEILRLRPPGRFLFPASRCTTFGWTGWTCHATPSWFL